MGKELVRGLTSQHLAFVESYLCNFSVKRAAKDAGYKDPGYGYELIRKTQIKEEIEKRTQACSEARIGLKERIIEELVSIGFATLQDVGRFGPSGLELKDDEDVPDSTKAAISEFTVNVNDRGITQKVRFHNKTDALKLLGQHLGMFKDQEVSVNIKPYIIRRRNGEEVELGINDASEDS